MMNYLFKTVKTGDFQWQTVNLLLNMVTSSVIFDNTTSSMLMSGQHSVSVGKTTWLCMGHTVIAPVCSSYIYIYFWNILDCMIRPTVRL